MEKTKGIYKYEEKLNQFYQDICDIKEDRIVIKQFFRENYEMLTKIKTACYIKNLKGNDKIREFCLVQGIIKDYEELKDSKIDNYFADIKKERKGETKPYLARKIRELFVDEAARRKYGAEAKLAAKQGKVDKNFYQWSNLSKEAFKNNFIPPLKERKPNLDYVVMYFCHIFYKELCDYDEKIKQQELINAKIEELQKPIQ